MNTAKLVNVELYKWPNTGNYYVCGKIYEDSRKRFTDGEPVRTSIIQEIQTDGDTTKIVTLNTTYTVVGKIFNP